MSRHFVLLVPLVLVATVFSVVALPVVVLPVVLGMFGDKLVDVVDWGLWGIGCHHRRCRSMLLSWLKLVPSCGRLLDPMGQ